MIILITLLLLSCLLLGVDKTKNSVLGSLCVPLFIKLTAFLPAYMSIPMDDPLLMTLFGAAMTGFGLGLVFKSGFTTGGTDILNQIVSKYAHMSIGSSMIFTDGLIILAGIFAFGWIQLMYSVISLYIISIMNLLRRKSTFRNLALLDYMMPFFSYSCRTLSFFKCF